MNTPANLPRTSLKITAVEIKIMRTTLIKRSVKPTAANQMPFGSSLTGQVFFLPEIAPSTIPLNIEVGRRVTEVAQDTTTSMAQDLGGATNVVKKIIPFPFMKAQNLLL